MPTPLLICVKAADGGLSVALFAVLGEMLQPKRFAGIFGASPAVALANLIVIALAKSDASARDAATGMIAGAAALTVACVAAIPAVRRWGAVRGSGVLWGVWVLAGGVAAIPVAGGASALAAVGPPTGGRPRPRPDAGPAGGRPRPDARPPGGQSHAGGRPPAGPDAGPDAHPHSGRGRLFGIDLGAWREIRPGGLALRFAFGAAVSVVAGLVGIVAGTRVGGVMLAAPAVLPATLTIIEKQEGRGPAVTEVKGAVPGAVALIGFALVAAASTVKLPLAVALLGALLAWLVVAIGGYLIQAAVLPSWRQEVRDLDKQRRDARAQVAMSG